jgi:iron complex transport system ATP-binding protein
VRLRRPVAAPERRPSGAVLVAAEGVVVELGGRRILDGVDVAVHAGEVVALVGPNGAGKSTLLGVLSGDLAPSAGRVVVDGTDVKGWRDHELALRRAVLPQQVAVSFAFRVVDVVRMGRAPWAGLPDDERDDDIVRESLVRTDALHLAPRSFPSLSGGERARVALARVLAQRTQVVFLDEPTAALDVHHQELVLEQARACADRGDAVVVVLHDLGLAAAHADRVVVIADGRVVADGGPGDVLRPELLSAVYHHDIEVFHHPVTGELLVLPRRLAVGDKTS